MSNRTLASAQTLTIATHSSQLGAIGFWQMTLAPRRAPGPRRPPPLFARLRHGARHRPGIARSAPRRSLRLLADRSSHTRLLFLLTQSLIYGLERHDDAHTSLEAPGEASP